MFGLPQYLWIYIVGYAILGFSQAFVFIPAIPDALDALYLAKDLREGEDEYVDGIISDKAAALYGSGLSSGLIIAPLLGSFVYSTLENSVFNKTTDVFFVISATFTVIFFFANFIFDVFKDK